MGARFSSGKQADEPAARLPGTGEKDAWRELRHT